LNGVARFFVWWRDYGVIAEIAPQVVARFGQSFETKEISQQATRLILREKTRETKLVTPA
jgi:hypothetical protein